MQLPLAKKSKSGLKLHKLPMQPQIAIILKNKEKRTAIATMVSHAILILRSLMTSLKNLVIFFMLYIFGVSNDEKQDDEANDDHNITCKRLFWLCDEFLIHGQYAAHKDYKHDGY